MTFPYPDPLVYLSRLALVCMQTGIDGAQAAALTDTPPFVWDPPQQICYRVSTQVPFDMDKYHDMCCEGLGYVAIGGTWPSSDQFPDQDIIRQANARCSPPAWAQEIRFGIVRCLPVVTEGIGQQEGGMPTCDEWTTAAYKNMFDSIALRKAVCCYRASILNLANPFFEGMSVVIDRQVQGPPLGGCVERYVTVQVQFPNCDCL